MLPLLEAEVVPPGWVTKDEFIAGYGAAQAVPGPLFTFGGYLGAAMEVVAPRWLGGLLALGAIFLPSFFLVVGVLPFWERLRGVAPRAAGADGRQRRGGRAAARGALRPGLDERDPRAGGLGRGRWLAWPRSRCWRSGACRRGYKLRVSSRPCMSSRRELEARCLRAL